MLIVCANVCHTAMQSGFHSVSSTLMIHHKYNLQGEERAAWPGEVALNNHQEKGDECLNHQHLEEMSLLKGEYHWGFTTCIDHNKNKCIRY